MNNLLTWSLQLAVMVALSALVPRLLRLGDPVRKLIYWQTVLLAGLMLPLIHPWQHEQVIITGIAATAPLPSAPLKLPAHSSTIPVSYWVLAAIGIGCVARMVWLLAGFWRMRKYRVESVPLQPMPSWGAEADLRVSADVQSPVTFGFIHPVVLLPLNFTALDETTQDAILCHEILHVRRKDWLFTLAEELIRTALWFHPAIWWVLGEIQLAREQTVDREVIGMTRSRDRYVDALLAIAGANPQTDLAPAPLFLRRRHLKQRVMSILKEAHMSKRKSLSALAASLTLLGGSCWLITDAIPLYGSPQMMSDAPGVAVDVNGAPLMHRNSVPYPAEAAVKHVEGTVTVQVKLDAKGNVADASIISGPDEFRKTVLQSVLNWHFAKSEANSIRQVTINFKAPKDAPTATAAVRVGDFSGPLPGPTPTVKSVQVVNNNEQARNEIMALVPVHIGDPMTPETMMNTAKAVREYDEHLSISTRNVSPTETQIVISQPPQTALAAPQYDGPKIRVAANIQEANLITQPKPSYPPLAKAARVQGTVRFETTIGPDGKVIELHLVSGPPLLVQAAMEAVQGWVYKPTLLNGNPVAVVTTIDVNFTLSQ